MRIMISHESAQSTEGWTAYGTQQEEISASLGSKNYTIIHRIWTWQCGCYVGYLAEIPGKRGSYIIVVLH